MRGGHTALSAAGTLGQSHPVADPRTVAVDLLAALEGGGVLDSLLEAADPSLPARDRAFARLLVLTVLRRRGQIDDVLARFLEKPLPPRRDRERQTLRVGAAQLLFLGTPGHAAVHATVAAAGSSPLKGLVNAVLRRVADEGPALLRAQDAPRINTPDWLWKLLCETLGAKTARAVAGVHLAEPPLDLTVRGDTDGWAERLGGRVLPTGSVRIAGARPVADLAGYSGGWWWVQDAAAALPAKLLLGAVADPASARIADLCAAPGGKTAQLAAAGAGVVAVDRSGERLGRLQANLARLGLHAETVAADATTWRPQAPFDAVLVDAPCSATGTIRRNPDLPWRKDAGSAAALLATQDRILDAAVAMLAPGGVLVFCTCSLDPREGPQRVAALLGRATRLERVPVHAEEVGGLDELIADKADLRTLPCHLAGEGGMDGFFAARLRRAE